MSALEGHLAAYLAVRRGLGFKLNNEERMLDNFVAFMETADASTITVDLALRWATMPAGVGHAYLAQRMRAVRGFSRYLHGIDPATEIPPLELLPARKHRPTPHIYTATEISALMIAALALRPALRAATMETPIGLLASTGLRDSEAFALDREDIDRANGLLRIRDSKHGKSREVLIHDSTIAALDGYLARRDQLRPGGDRVCVFVSSWGSRLSHKSVYHSFSQIRRAAGVTGTAPGRPPRLHDLRHAFSVRIICSTGCHRAVVAGVRLSTRVSTDELAVEHPRRHHRSSEWRSRSPPGP
ncbi:MAG: tyrosine-type recombinase/integrase [Solirubrobacteraceae bacterium]